MEDAILRTGDLKRFHKFVRKKGVEAILDEDTFQLVLANPIYSDFDMIGAWLSEVIKAGRWEEIRPSVRKSVQGAPFRLVTFERLTPKRLMKTIDLILGEAKGLTLRHWLPWIILCREKCEKWSLKTLDDAVFTLLFYEALDFAFRAKGDNTNNFQHMFHTGALTLKVRTRYLAYCQDCLAADPVRCGQIQLLGEGICEVAPFMLAYQLDLEVLAIAIMSFMDDPYLAYIRQTFLGQIHEATCEVTFPRYLFDAHPALDHPLARGVPLYTFRPEEMEGVFRQKEILDLILETQPEVIRIEEVFEDVVDASLNLPQSLLSKLCGDNVDYISGWLEDHPRERADVVALLAKSLTKEMIPPSLIPSILFHVPLGDDLLNLLSHGFHVHPPMVEWYLLYLLDLCVRGQTEKLKRVFSLTLSFPHDSLLTEQLSFFDKEIFKGLAKGLWTPPVWTELCRSGLLRQFPRCRTLSKRPRTWDRIILKTQREVVGFLTPLWACVGPIVGEIKGTNFLMRVIQWTGKGLQDVEDLWALAEGYSPNYLWSYKGVTALHMALKKQPKSSWIKQKIEEIENYQ